MPTIDVTYPRLHEPPAAVPGAAARMLPSHPSAVAYDVQADSLLVVTTTPPTPHEYRQLEERTGMNVVVTLADDAVWQRTRDLARQALPAGAPTGVGALLELASTMRATDVLLACGEQPRVRVDGAFHQPSGFPRLTAQDMTEALSWASVDDTRAQTAQSDRRTLVYANRRWRVDIAPSCSGPTAAFRSHPLTTPRLDELGGPDELAALAELHRGLVLVGGSPGSGKSTTAAAIVEAVNASRPARILTLERTREFRITSLTASVTQHELPHERDWAQPWVRDLAFSADVLLLDALTTHEQVDLALRCAERGQLVIATVNSASPEGAVRTLLDTQPDAYRAGTGSRVAEALAAVVAQTLVPRADGAGVQMACEVLLGIEPVRDTLRRGTLRELGGHVESYRGRGLLSMERSLANLVHAGRIAPVTAQACALRPARLHALAALTEAKPAAGASPR